MQANHHLSTDLLANEQQFNHPFFNRFTLTKAAAPLQLNSELNKQYSFPTFYANSTCTIAIFHCDYQAAKAMMPCASMEPIKMTGGRSLVIFSCYEYRDVYHITPYNEIAMTIPVMTDKGRQMPVLSMLLGDKLNKFGYHVFHMPVTSKENRIRGNKIWGLPKTLENIAITKNEKQISIAASIDDNPAYFQLKVPLKGNMQTFDVQSNLFSVKQQQRLKSPTAFVGDFQVNKNLANLFKPDHHSTPAITLGEGRVADQLRQLKIESVPFQTRYCNDFNACFDLPTATQEVR